MIITNKEKFRTDEKVLVECDFKFSSKCKLQYYKLYKNILKSRSANDGKDRCQYCFNSLTKTDKNNFNYKYEKNEDFFENIDSELKAYLLGWVAGDGCLKKDGLYISVHWMDKEILELFRDVLCPTKTIFFRKYDNTMNLIINSVYIMKSLCKHLKLKSFGKKSHDIIFPDLPDELIISFIRGLVDSDGNIGNIMNSMSPRCSYASASSVIRSQLIKFCNKYNIKGYSAKNSVNVNFRGSNALNFMNLIYEGANYYLTRKRAMFKLWKTWVPRIGTCVIKRKAYIIPEEQKNKRIKSVILSNKKRRKLSNENLKDIFNRSKLGESQYEIAAVYNVSQSTISEILLKKIYKDFEE